MGQFSGSGFLSRKPRVLLKPHATLCQRPYFGLKILTDGAAAPLSPLAYAMGRVSLTIGGVNAPVAFAGLTPGFVGLYQINATVPPGVPPGSQVPVVINVAGQASPPVTMAVR